MKITLWAMPHRLKDGRWVTSSAAVAHMVMLQRKRGNPVLAPWVAGGAK